MKVIVLTRTRKVFTQDATVATMRTQLQSLALTSVLNLIKTSDYSLVEGVKVTWGPADAFYSIGLEGVALGPCMPPIFFYAADETDLTDTQVELILMQLVKLPGVIDCIQPQQLDYSVRSGEADTANVRWRQQ